MIDGERDRAGNLDAASEDGFSGEASGGSPTARSARRATLPPTNEEAGLGTALRDIYQQTINEDIPPEMLDLLNRLA